MKHTTFENELRDIRRRAIQELKDALAAHNGEYVFHYQPIIYLYRGRITKVQLKDNTLRIYITEFDNETKHIATQDTVNIDDILNITGHIPQTNDVEDVSGVYPVPVTWVDRDDIESAGFDASEITQDGLTKISEQMQNSYLYSGQFIEDVRYACKQCGLKEKED